MDIKELYLNGGLTAVGDDAEFERKHPRKGGKFVKKGEGEAKKDGDGKGVNITEGDIVAYVGKNVDGEKHKPLGVVVRVDSENGKKFYTADFNGHLSKVPASEIRAATKEEADSAFETTKAFSKKVKSGEYAKNVAKKSDGEAKKTILEKMFEMVAKSTGVSVEECKKVIANGIKDGNIQTYKDAIIAVENAQPDKVVRDLIEDGIAKANKGKGGLVVLGNCRVSVYSTSKGDCYVSIAYLRDPDESVDDTNAAIKNQYDRVAAFLKKNGFELQGDAHKFDNKYLDGFGDRPIELFTLGWVKKVGK